MRRSIMMLFAMVLFIGGQLGASAQKYFSNLDRVSEAVEHKLHDGMLGWKCKSVPPSPIPPAPYGNSIVNDKVKIQAWSSERTNVKVSILHNQSEESAAKALHDFASALRTEARIQGLGDEAYLFGVEGGIAFRKGNLTIYVSAMSLPRVDSNKSINDINRANQAAHDEEAAVTKVFAQHIADALEMF